MAVTGSTHGVDLAQAWPALLDRLRNPDNEQGVRTWLASPKVRPTSLSDGVLTIECPTPLFQYTIRDRYAKPLATLASDVFGVPVSDVVCRVSGAALRAHEDRIERAAPTVNNAPAPANAVTRSPRFGHGFKLLEDFVVGASNRLAFDAVKRILDDPSYSANPLFIHGASGLGKTHLEQGLAMAFKERHPKAKVQYIRCEQFTNDYIAACDAGPEGLKAFRIRMRHPDLLLIDDIHFLSRGQMVKTKEELFATFNELTEQGKRVVITSDAHPSDIRYLEDRFVQRFAGGLVVSLAKPDPQVRRDVVAAKARTLNLTMGDEVVDYVCEHIIDNIRELEGAVNKLGAFAASFQRRIDLALARQALADLIDRGGSEPRLKQICRAVADHFEITVDDLLGKSRSGPRAQARHVAMYVLKLTGSDTYSAIANAFAVKSHSSVAYACEQVAQARSRESGLDRFIVDLVARLKRV
jgi:chromosomal replication initiator protein